MQTSAPAPSIALQRIRQRLEKLELEHLRQHIVEQAARIEQLEALLAAAEDEAADAWRCAEGWQATAMENLTELQELGADVALTPAGDFLVTPPEATDLHTAGYIVMEEAQ